MTTTAYHARGTKLKIGDGGTPEIFTEVAGCHDFDGPGGANETIDITNHSSPGRSKEFIAGDKGEEKISFELEWDPADTQHQAIEDLYDSGELNNFQYARVDDDATTDEFAAMVTNFREKNPVGGTMRLDVELTISGEREAAGS